MMEEVKRSERKYKNPRNRGTESVGREWDGERQEYRQLEIMNPFLSSFCHHANMELLKHFVINYFKYIGNKHPTSCRI